MIFAEIYAVIAILSFNMCLFDAARLKALDMPAVVVCFMMGLLWPISLIWAITGEWVGIRKEYKERNKQ